jgi:hypothetical protein
MNDGNFPFWEVEVAVKKSEIPFEYLPDHPFCHIFANRTDTSLQLLTKNKEPQSGKTGQIDIFGLRKKLQ